MNTIRKFEFNRTILKCLNQRLVLSFTDVRSDNNWRKTLPMKYFVYFIIFLILLKIYPFKKSFLTQIDIWLICGILDKNIKLQRFLDIFIMYNDIHLLSHSKDLNKCCSTDNINNNKDIIRIGIFNIKRQLFNFQ